jgi:hypothetical protein
MTATWTTEWLPRVLLGGSLLLLLTRLLLGLSAQPARRQRLAEGGMAAALLLVLLSFAPAWLIVPVATPAAPEDSVGRGAPETANDPEALFLPEAVPGLEGEGFAGLGDFQAFAEPEPFSPPKEPLSPPAQADAAVEEKPAPDFWHALRSHWEGLVGGIYALGAGLFLGRWLLGHIGLYRLVRDVDPVPERVGRLFEAMNPGRARLRTSRRTSVPFSCGLLRPTVVLPTSLAESASDEALRWVFAHELTHLRRRDGLAGLLFGLGQTAYFPLPWFWSLRRQVRLCQEQVADAAAAAEGRPEDYAQFLLTWTTPPILPVGALGVWGRSSDLFRRVTMLLQSPVAVERRCPRRWSLAAAGLLVPAVLVAGLGFQTIVGPVSTARADDTKKDDKKDDTKKKENKNLPPGINFPDIEEILKNLPQGPEREEMRKQMMELRERMRKMMENRTQPGGGAPSLGGFGGFGGFGQPGRFGGGGGGGFFGGISQGRLGARVEQPSPTLADQLDLPRDTGLIIDEIRPDSPAAKAGLKPHDVLLELNGKPVPNDPARFVRMLNEIKADTKVDAVVLRKGKKETIKGLTLPEAKDVGPGFPGGPPGGFPGGGPPAGRGFGGGAVFPPGGGPPGGFPGGGFGVGGGGGRGVMTTIFRTSDHFTTRYQEGSLVITVTGKVEDGKGKTTEIQIQDGRETHKYESVDKVPEQYRDKVKNLVETSEKSGTKIEIK